MQPDNRAEDSSLTLHEQAEFGAEMALVRYGSKVQLVIGNLDGSCLFNLTKEDARAMIEWLKGWVDADAA